MCERGVWDAAKSSIEGGVDSDVETGIGDALREFRAHRPPGLLGVIGRLVAGAFGGLLCLASLVGMSQRDAASATIVGGIGAGLLWLAIRNGSAGRRKVGLAMGLVLLAAWAIFWGQAARTEVGDRHGGAPPNFRPMISLWVKDQIKEALGRHGTFNGDEWTTVVLRSFRANSGREVFEERFFTIKGIDFPCEMVELSEADRLNGYEWAVNVTPTATAHRYARLDGSTTAPWEDGLAFEMPTFFAQKKSGVVYWGTYGNNPFLAAMAVFLDPATLSPGQDDALDAILQAMQSPARPAAGRQAIRHIVRVLDADRDQSTRARQAIGDAAAGQTQLHARIADAMSKIDLGGCPIDVATAYRAHIQAWRTDDTAGIETTFEEVLRRARQHGVGTAFYES